MSLLKTGACFTAELELNCPTIVACIAALPTGPVAAPGTLVLGADGQYHALPAVADAPIPCAEVQACVASLPIGADAVFGTTVLLGNDGQYHALPSPSAAATDCAAVAACIAALPVGPTAVFGTTAVLGADGQYHALPVPAAAAVTFATPAQTIAGTSAVLAVNPADLYARENIAAQTGLGLVLSAIPAPTAAQSVWGVNTLGETLHYAPGLGWKIVAAFYGSQVEQPAGVIPTPASAWTTAVSLVVPRAGRVVVTAHVVVDSAAHYAHAGGLSINGIVKTASNSLDIGPSGTPTFLAGGSSPYQSSSTNSVTSWTGDVSAGTVIATQGITIGSTGQLRIANLEYTYLN
jgi:hypothetical protein